MSPSAEASKALIREACAFSIISRAPMSSTTATMAQPAWLKNGFWFGFTFAMLVMGRTMNADEAREAGFVNEVVAPGQTEWEARKVAREICALPAEAVAITRKLVKLPPEDMTRRIDQEAHLFAERLSSKEAMAAFKAFVARRKAG